MRELSGDLRPPLADTSSRAYSPPFARRYPSLNSAAVSSVKAFDPYTLE